MRGGRPKYRVLMDDVDVAQFTKLLDAVQAVDYEIQKRGPGVEASARRAAAWRSEPPAQALVDKLSALRPPRGAKTVAQALGHLAHARRARRFIWGEVPRDEAFGI